MKVWKITTNCDNFEFMEMLQVQFYPLYSFQGGCHYFIRYHMCTCFDAVCNEFLLFAISMSPESLYGSVSTYYINFKCCVLVKNFLTNHYQIYQKKSKLHVTPVGDRNCNIMTFKPSLTKFWCEMGNKFIVPTMLAKPRPPWLLVAMSHIFIIMAISALKFSI